MNTLDETLSIVANVHRRRLLVTLFERDIQPDEALPVPDWVYAGNTEPEILELEMYHNHLPRLEGAGFIEWSKENQAVEKGPNFDAVEQLLQWLARHETEGTQSELELVSYATD